MANNIYGVPNFYGSQQPMFPQPNGNIYVISNSLEVANVPAGAGITAALCQSESLLYLKTVQNGVPTFLAYKLTPYTESPKMPTQENDLENRLATLEKQLSTLLIALEVSEMMNNLLPAAANAVSAATANDWS